MIKEPCNHMLPIISVGIVSRPHVHFNCTGPYRLIETGDIWHGNGDVSCCDGRLWLGRQAFDALLFEPCSADSCFELYDVTIGKQFHWQRNETQIFDGALKLLPDGSNVVAINVVDAETYLKSVIASEMRATAMPELLRAHAVISRSWLLAPILQPHESLSAVTEQLSADTIVRWYERDMHTLFDVCADDHCQRYQGRKWSGNTAVAEAVEYTRGMVLMYDGVICDARFSKSCGGVSERFESCWSDVPHAYLQPVRDAEDDGVSDLTQETQADAWIRSTPNAFCNTTDPELLRQVLNNYDRECTDFYRWQVRYTQAQLSTLVRCRSGIDFGRVDALIPLQRGASGRITLLKIVGSHRTLTVGKELEIRKWLSNTHLRSSAFVVDRTTSGDFILTGAGWGHGVGLCQIGAAVMASKGYTYEAILQHYFRKAELRRLY